MQAQATTFDTHAYVKRLTRAGMSEDQAEASPMGKPTFMNIWSLKNTSNSPSNMHLRNSGPN